ncbi:MAG TPA: alkaline phosphatase family protein [Candidatus Cybelea sp.]|nr:alkaline phosphatase family protein [Candidatus Cybelea sp.]
MRLFTAISRLAFVGAATLGIAACGGGSATGPVAPPQPPPPPGASKIQHVVIIVQENRSFNNLFYGYPGARTASYGYDSDGKKVQLHPIGLETTWDLDHSSGSFLTACNGRGVYPGTDCRMNGFNNEWVGCGHYSYPPCPNANPPYSYVPHYETRPYFDMAHQYVLADEMFASNFDASSFISHQYIIAGQASSAVNYPDSWWGCEGGPSDRIGTITQARRYGPDIQACFNNTTLGDELDAAGLSWGYYTATIDGDGNLWSAYQAISHIYHGPDWKKDVISPQTRFFGDVSHGRLRDVSWITPTCENSDHAGCGSRTGPSWVTSLVNAIGKSRYWNSTAIFVFWDDYGGWYDPVPPEKLDYDGLGMRIPLLVISPYAKAGYVSHVHYEHGSILRFIEDRFALPQLAATDTRATSPEDDCFDFNAAPRRFVPIAAPFDTQYFLRQPPDHRLPDAE